MTEDRPMTARELFQRELAGVMLSLKKNIDRYLSQHSDLVTARNWSGGGGGTSSIDRGC